MDYLQFTGFEVIPELSVVKTGGTVVYTELQQEDCEK
jgi:hypothetical protein